MPRSPPSSSLLLPAGVPLCASAPGGGRRRCLSRGLLRLGVSCSRHGRSPSTRTRSLLPSSLHPVCVQPPPLQQLGRRRAATASAASSLVEVEGRAGAASAVLGRVGVAAGQLKATNA
ncbi:hypothetical protein E2562_006407 [Oryza meyeriana var. granulata]|uniref:Uncharacterized protein n=1 Tax=Oryza meyeriana var. granulata TaxID=110450 RepID=A0A6G1EHT7_9ORYZ|nr:hypothetical protein E2562_006407 [Oryza meyeriana var. granulata]